MLPTSMKMSGFVVVLNKTKDITPILPIGLDLKRLPKRGGRKAPIVNESANHEASVVTEQNLRGNRQN